MLIFENNKSLSKIKDLAGSRVVLQPSVVDEIRSPSLTSSVPSVPSAPSSPESSEIQAGTQIEPIFSSSQQSSLFLPSLTNSEKFFGIILDSLSKPRIVGILENEIVSNGIPKESVIFIQRLNTEKYFELKYTILRRATFYETNYYEVGELTGDSISLGQAYANIAKEYFPNYKNLITFVDTNLNAHQSYAYKIKVEYRELTEEEKSSKKFRVNPLLSEINFNSSLFNTGDD